MKLSKLLNWKVILVVAAILVIIFFSNIINFLADLQWFKEIGYVGVFFTKFLAVLKIGIPLFVLLAVIFYAYMILLKSEYLKYSSIVYSKQQNKSTNRKLLFISAVISVLVSSAMTSLHWSDILKFINGGSFNTADPLFHKDIGFYVFKLPVYQVLYSFVFGMLIILLLITLAFYLFLYTTTHFEQKSEMGNVLHMDRGSRNAIGRQIFEYAAKHISFLVSAIFLMISLGFILKSYDLVYSPRGAAFGASYTDVHVTLLFYRAFAVLSIIAAASIFYALYRRKLKLTLWIVGIMIGASLIQGITEVVIQKFIVSPNEMVMERPYIEYNIKYTRMAYGLENVEEKDFPVEQNLTPQDLENNKATINNIRVNDFAPALTVYNQLQGIRSYYNFNDVDIDRYNIDGKYTQVFVAARELDQKKLDAQSQTWLNKHLIYTHGYGIAMSPVNTVTPEGQPELIIKDIPPVSSTDIKIDKPEIYFGESTDDYIITNTRQKEMDYPSGDSNKQTIYSGTAGIKLSPLNRLLFMFNKGSLNFLLSQDINSNSKIVMNRNIMDRVKKIAPFLTYDEDPYIVVNNGKLYWIIDAYTTSDSYPFSEPTGGINYIRNSIKVIIDAYNGTTNFYLIDDKDPLANAYSRIFPGLLKSASELPQGFVEHFRYPESIFNIQADVYKKYHMTDPNVFYNKEDMWSMAGASQDETQNTEQNQARAESSYVIMKLPDGTDEEFMLISPYSPVKKGNMVAWFGARMDKQEYGKLIVYKFPKQKNIYGPSQFKARVNQDPDISKEKSLWGQQGSTVIDGTTLIIPIENSLLYVMPLYIKSTTTNSIPEMKRVILMYGDKIVMEDTLNDALAKMFNLNQQVNTPPAQQRQPSSAVQPDKSTADLIKKASDAFTKAKDAQKAGDWAEYGRQLDELEKALNDLNLLAK